ncbi:hypothetical protein QUA81_22475 [Microcoleus sp. F6_B4]
MGKLTIGFLLWQFRELPSISIETTVGCWMAKKTVCDIAILAGFVKFLPHPNPPQGIGEGVRNSQMMRGLQ